MRRLILLITLFSAPTLNGYAQSLTDSLEQLVVATQGEEQIRAMIRLGNIYTNSEPDKGLDLGLKAAFLSKRLGNTNYEGQAILLMGISSLKAGQPENALRYLNRALGHFEKHNQKTFQADALIGIAALYEAVFDYTNALNFLNRAQDIYRQLGRKKAQIDLHQRIGNISIKVKNFAQAHKEYTSALKLLEGEMGSREQKNIAFSLSQIGYLYRNLGQLNESIEAYTKAIGMNKELQQTQEFAKNLSEIALSYQLMRKPDSALTYYSKALSYYQLQSDALSTIEILQSIGDVFFDKQQYFQAVASYNQALQMAIKASNIPSQISALVSISRCHSAVSDYNLSAEFLNRALALAKKQNLTTSAAEVYQYLSQVNEASGKYVQALEYYKLWSEIRDSLYIEESGKNLARIQILYDISQKERENEILRQNNEIQELQLVKTRYQRFVFIALALFLFALLILLGFFYKGKQKEYRKQKETELRIIELNKNLEKRMIAEIKKQEKQQLLLSQKSKLESLGTLAAGIAHEINQPLGGISMGLDNILIKLSEKHLTDEYMKDKVSSLFENVERIKKIIDHVRTFSRAQKPASFGRVDINAVIHDALSMVKVQFESNSIDVITNLTNSLALAIGDKYKFEQVILNLLGNAKQAIEEKDKLTPYGANKKYIIIESSQDPINIYVKVRDNGIGIKKKDIDKIFDPFYTTKKEDKGTGLGLSISYGIIKDILGDIRVESEEGEYTVFELVIPIT